jgi:hypothetical protein
MLDLFQIFYSLFLIPKVVLGISKLVLQLSCIYEKSFEFYCGNLMETLQHCKKLLYGSCCFSEIFPKGFKLILCQNRLSFVLK